MKLNADFCRRLADKYEQQGYIDLAMYNFGDDEDYEFRVLIAALREIAARAA